MLAPLHTHPPVDAMLPSPHQVVGVRRENHDTFTLTLKPESGNAPLVFKPGQFNMLYVHGVGEAPISISGDPSQTARLMHTTRAVGAVTQAMGKLRRGDTLGLRGPFGTHWPLEAARGRDLVIVAGGIGLAPLRPVLCHIFGRHRSDFGRVTVLYGARSPNDLLFAKEFAEWRRRKDSDIRVTVDHSIGDWRGDVGVVTALIPRAAMDPSSAMAMVCGPEIMMRFTVKSLLTRGMPEENIFVSMERNMKCAVGFCGRCQLGPEFICKDGPVFSHARIGRLLTIREL